MVQSLSGSSPPRDGAARESSILARGRAMVQGPPGSSPPRGGAAHGRPRLTAVVSLALLNVLIIAAGGVLAWRLPARLALWKVPVVASRPVIRPHALVIGAGAGGPLPTRAGLAARLSGLLSAASLGSHVTAVVGDLASGQVLFSRDPNSPAAPASTAKLATAVAALDVLGPGARFTTRVVEDATARNAARRGTARIVLVGGGDPTLAAGRTPAGGYPRPATLEALASATARALAAQHRTAVRLGYDTSLYSGPQLAPGWSETYVTTGNVTPITSLEVDQGRLLADGKPQDADEPGNLRPRSLTPAADAAGAFAAFLARDGIRVDGPARPAGPAAGAVPIARVSSPPVAAMVEQMLTESNNVIAENLARHVALATGAPGSFSGAAGAVMTAIRRLGAAAGVRLVDGSGLSPDDRIPAAALFRLVSVAASVRHPALRAAVTGMPVAGFSGTLTRGQSVFGDLAAAARGLVRAKTGNLDTVVSMAGLAYDRAGTVLAFAFMADRVPSVRDLPQAAGTVDKLADALAGCGCR
jgi:D-alanyl-D-alanine carboxypeptidase/D-alanyl-D-alanine-endopeptidase (penicillin-binding protein 4)